jgi:hypothetical protein
MHSKSKQMTLVQEVEDGTGGVTQAVERLLCKHQSLSSNPNHTKGKKKKVEDEAERWWWYTAIISVLGRQRQDDHRFKGSLGYIAKPCLKKQINI